MTTTAAKPTGTAVARSPLVATGAPVLAIAPKSIEEVYRYAQGIAKAGWAPSSYLVDPRNAHSGFSVDKIAIGICMGAEVGLPPLMSVQSIAVINGMPALWGDGLLGVLLSSSQLEDHDEGYDEEKQQGWCKMKRKGRKSLQRLFSMEDAKTAQLLGKDNWKKYPKRMCTLRARGFCGRDGFADVLKGMRIAEEAMDMGSLEAGADGTYAPVHPAEARPVYGGEAAVLATEPEPAEAEPEDVPSEPATADPAPWELLDWDGTPLPDSQEPIAAQLSEALPDTPTNAQIMGIYEHNEAAIGWAKGQGQDFAWLEKLYAAAQKAERKLQRQAEREKAKADAPPAAPAPVSDAPPPAVDAGPPPADAPAPGKLASQSDPLRSFAPPAEVTAQLAAGNLNGFVKWFPGCLDAAPDDKVSELIMLYADAYEQISDIAKKGGTGSRTATKFLGLVEARTAKIQAAATAPQAEAGLADDYD